MFRSGISTVIFLCLIALCLSCGGCKDSRSSTKTPVPLTPALREDYAWEDLLAMLQSYLEDTQEKPNGLVDAWWFSEFLNLDGWDLTDYLVLFMDADAAEESGSADVRLIYDEGGDCVSYSDVSVSWTWSPDNLDEPVLGEVSIVGGTDCDDDGIDEWFYDALRYFFMLEDEDGIFMMIEPGPMWEYETQAEPPVSFGFIVDEVKVNGDDVYVLTDEDIGDFPIVQLEVVPGDELIVDLGMLAFGSDEAAFVDVETSIRLFWEDSPAFVEYHGEVSNLSSFESFADLGWDDYVTASALLRIPSDIPEGIYSLLIMVNSFSAGGEDGFSRDRIFVPIRVLVP